MGFCLDKYKTRHWRVLPFSISIELLQMRRDEFGHLEHCNFTLATEHYLELVIREDVALVRRVLKVVLLDVDPKLLDYFGSRHRAGTDDRFQFWREGKGL